MAHASSAAGKSTGGVLNVRTPLGSKPVTWNRHPGPRQRVQNHPHSITGLRPRSALVQTSFGVEGPHGGYRFHK